MKQRVSIVLTCLNEVDLLVISIPKIEAVLSRTDFTPHFIVVDDGSKKQAVVREKLSKQTNISILLHEQNEGRGKAVSDGILVADTEYVAFIDPDLELPPEGLFDLFAALSEGADVAIAKRYYNFTFRDLVRVVLSRGYSMLTQVLLGLPLADTEAGLKAFKREKFLPILKETCDTRWFWDTEVMTRSYYAGLTVREVPAVVMKREDKETTVRLLRDAWVYFWSLWRFRKKLRGLKRASV